MFLFLVISFISDNKRLSLVRRKRSGVRLLKRLSAINLPSMHTPLLNAGQHLSRDLRVFFPGITQDYCALIEVVFLSLV